MIAREQELKVFIKDNGRYLTVSVSTAISRPLFLSRLLPEL